MREYISPVADRPAIYRRLMTLGPVVLLHLFLLFAFLNILRVSFESRLPEHEIIFLLKPAPVVPNWQGDLLPPIGSTAIAVPHFALPEVETYRASAPNPQAIAPELQGVGRALFRCWSGGLTGPAQVQAAQCLTLAPHQPDSLNTPEESRNAAEWFLDRDRRNAPLRLPCTYGMTPATVFCVAMGVINGFDLKSAPSYAEEDDDDPHWSEIDTLQHEMQTVDPCALDRTQGLGFVCLYRVLNGNKPP